MVVGPSVPARRFTASGMTRYSAVAAGGLCLAGSRLLWTQSGPSPPHLLSGSQDYRVLRERKAECE